jgi:carboxyl-terminal processing protease
VSSRKASLVALAGAGCLAVSGLLLPRQVGLAPPNSSASPPPAAAPSAPIDSGLDCARARIVVREVRERLAAPVPALDDELFAELVVGWLDPHGLWSAAPDAATGALVYERSRQLRAEIETGAGDCSEARRLGGALWSWVHELSQIFDRERQQALPGPRDVAYELAAGAVFEDDPVTRPARELAGELGRRTGAFERAFVELAPVIGDQARARYFPEHSAFAWEQAVLAAAVRAYVAAVDPHGQWVPHDEESSLYLDDPTFDGEPRLWGEMMRTSLGVRIVDSPARPLELDDLVLEIDGVITAGLSVEHVEELGLSPVDAAAPIKHVQILRQGSSRAQAIAVDFDAEQALAPESPSLETVHVPYGSSSALLVRIPEVPEDLGDELAALVAELEPDLRPAGILLDLRGNGGGSTTGACGALGVFLPGAPAFPLLHRGRLIEVLSALAPARAGRWRGPVAALVDARTASAAEMIAGGLERYDRGIAIGARTFGKGCVQEYFDDAAGAGVLRLTTLLFALPDGASLQRVGLEPRLRLEPEAETEASEREADLDGALAPQSGPDVRAAPWFGGPAWPDHQGRVGPCADPAVCKALRRVGAGASAARRGSGLVRRRSPAR